MMKLIKFIIIFGLVMSVAMFGFIFLKSLLGDNIISPIATELKSVSTSLGLPAIINTTIDDMTAYFIAFDFKADLLFLITWIAFEVTIVLFAINLPKLPTMNFLSFLTFGMLIVMFFFDFVRQFSEWFVQNFINNVFSYADSYLPIFNFYNTYQPIIIFFNIIMVLFINQLFELMKDKTDSLFGGDEGGDAIPPINERAVGGLEE